MILMLRASEIETVKNYSFFIPLQLKWGITKIAVNLNILIICSIISISNLSLNSQARNNIDSNYSFNQRIENSFTLNCGVAQKKGAGTFFKKLNANPYIKPPEIILNLFGGYIQPLSQFKGDLFNFSTSDTSSQYLSYYQKWGFDIGFNVKFPIDRSARFRVMLSLLYSKFYQNGTDITGSYDVKPRFNIFQVGLGGEWAFPYFQKVIPFINTNFTASILDGSTEIINTSLSYDLVRNYNPATRYGVSIGTGAEYIINSDVGVIAGINYNISNLIGRAYNTTGGHDINDASFTNYGKNIDTKTISFLNFYAGLSVYLGYNKIKL